MLLEKILAALILLACLLVLLRAAVGARRRQQWDAAARRVFMGSRRAGLALVEGWRRWRGRHGAAKEAQAAIDRARRTGYSASSDGKVIRPTAFKDKNRRDNKLH